MTSVTDLQYTRTLTWSGARVKYSRVCVTTAWRHVYENVSKAAAALGPAPPGSGYPAQARQRSMQRKNPRGSLKISTSTNFTTNTQSELDDDNATAVFFLLFH